MYKRKQKVNKINVFFAVSQSMSSLVKYWMDLLIFDNSF